MKTNSKKWILGLSALAFAGCLTFACGATINASADETQQPTVTATANENIKFRGISIRYNQVDGQDGIRFGTLINKDWYDALQGEKTTATVIVPTALLASEDYAGVMSATDAEVVDTTSLLTYTVTIDDVTYYKPTVYIHSIEEQFYNTELTALSYVAIDGEVTYYTGELLQHSVASAAKWLVENGKEEVNDMKDYLYYTVTYRDTDGSVLDTQRVKYGETTTYQGATKPTKTGDMNTSYLFAGFNDGAPVTSDTEYTANYAIYKNMDNYYYCVNEKFTLPSQVGSGIEKYGLTYKFDGETIEKNQELEVATPGKYTYEITVGELGTISTEVEVMSEENYEKNFFKTNTNQFFTNVGSTNGKIIVNGNNELVVMSDGSYAYTATRASAWDDRISLGADFVGGSSVRWNIAEYLTFSFGIKLAQGTTLANPKYIVSENVGGNGNTEWAMQFVDAQGNIVKSTDMQAGVWYTAIADLSMAQNKETNALFFYLFYHEEGTIYFKDMQFDGVENPERYNKVYISNTGAGRYMNTSTAVIDGVQTSYKYEKTTDASVYGLHANISFSDNAKANYNAITFRMYVEKSNYGDGTKGCGFTFARSSGSATIIVYDETTGEKVDKANMAHGKWYTVVASDTLTSSTGASSLTSNWYVYADGSTGQLTAYFADFRYLNASVSGGAMSVASNASLYAVGMNTYLYNKGVSRTDGNAQYDTRIIFPAEKTVTFDVCVLASGSAVGDKVGAKVRDLNNSYVSPATVVVKATGATASTDTSEMLLGVWYTVTFSATSKAKNLYWNVAVAGTLNALIANVSIY